MSKEERLQMVRAGREDREKYQSRTAVKQKKVGSLLFSAIKVRCLGDGRQFLTFFVWQSGGKSNREKEHNKKMPIAAKRQKIVRSRMEKARKSRHSGKQFRGKKAWK